MTRRLNGPHRCQRCRLHKGLCLCALIPQLETATRLVLVIHHFEDRKPTNTGRLATQCLPNSEVLVRGIASQPADHLELPADRRPLLLFPDPDAIPLDELVAGAGNCDDRPFTLIVPDGNWRQASRVRKRVPGLADIPCVRLPPGPPSRYQLRSEAHAHGLATIEAIARAFGILEGAEVQAAIEHIFTIMVERTLWSRGRLDAAAVSGGVPEAAVRHDPRGRIAPPATTPARVPR